ncbi:hypothetical protein RHGRI_007200 [Rhododendron griersonianum]|uniref:Uncharacterized protein n=2 Tax=Rhododendron griersonianum TaxID=479676 RepID=A0AAV6KXS1_9ERIC|nr:hypothetical protein RHGRI_007200 [Rhododendron griersonianum]
MLVMKMKAVQIDEAHDLEVNGKSVDSALETSNVYLVHVGFRFYCSDCKRATDVVFNHSTGDTVCSETMCLAASPTLFRSPMPREKEMMEAMSGSWRSRSGFSIILANIIIDSTNGSKRAPATTTNAAAVATHSTVNDRAAISHCTCYENVRRKNGPHAMDSENSPGLMDANRMALLKTSNKKLIWVHLRNLCQWILHQFTDKQFYNQNLDWVVQMYEQFDAESVDVDDARLEYFAKKVFSKIKDFVQSCLCGAVARNIPCKLVISRLFGGFSGEVLEIHEEDRPHEVEGDDRGGGLTAPPQPSL